MSGREAEGRKLMERNGFILLLVFMLVFAAYSAAPLGDFVWDDRPLIVEKSSIHELQPLPSYFNKLFFGGPAGAPSRSFYRPLVVISFALDWSLWDGSPLGFHLSNLLLHLACVALVFALGRKLGASAAAAGGAAALFGTLPRLTEAVAWISGRTDLLASFFVLLALWLYRPTAGRRWLGAASLLAGLFSKEVAAAGVLAWICWEWAELRQEERKDRRAFLARLVPLGSVLGAYTVLRVWASLSSRAADSLSPDASFLRRIAMSVETLGTYVWMALDPLRPRTQIGSRVEAKFALVALGLLTAIALVLVGIRAWRRGWLGGREWGLVALLLVPIALVLHIVPLPLNVLAADRFLYLPAAAACLALAKFSTRLSELAQRRALLLSLPLVALFGWVSHARSQVWASDLSLWSEAVQHAPSGNSLPHLNLANALVRAGAAEEAFPYIDEAEAIETAALRRLASELGSTGVEDARALAWLALGEYEKAAAGYRSLARKFPADPVHAYNLAVTLSLRLDFEGARGELESCLQAFPDFRSANAYLRKLDGLEARFGPLPLAEEGEEPEADFRRAALYHELGRREDAKAIWSKLAQAPTVPQRMREEAARLSGLD